MLKFDPKKVRFQNVKIKRVTSALGGSISVLDEPHFEKTGKEKFHKIEVPLAVARMFKVKYKMTQFIVPHESVIMWYDDKVVTVEKSVENERYQVSFEGVKEKWTSLCEHNYREVHENHIADSLIDWYFDGIYIYSFHGESLDSVVKRGEHLDEHGSFRSITVQAISLPSLNFKPGDTENRSCVAMVVNDDVYSISAPIWKAFDKKSRAVKTTEIDEDGAKVSLISSFKGIDPHIAINLNFALRAAKELADQFGYESIQPLHLPKMMVQLKTVNLPRLPKEVKATTDVGLKFTHGLAWLLGMQYQATTPQQFYTIRQLTKYLMTKGYFWKEKTKRNRILLDKTSNTVPLLTMDQLLAKHQPPQLITAAQLTLTGV